MIMTIQSISKALSAHLASTDGGFKSRKLLFAILTSLLIFGGGILAGKFQWFGPHYETMIGGLIGVLTVYLTGNVGSRWIAGNHAVALAGKVESEQETVDTPEK